MMGEAISEKGLPFRLVAVDPTPNCPARQFLDDQLVGDFKNPVHIRELARRSDIVTYEIELANGEVLEKLRREGKPVHPSPETLQIIQDKYIQADFLRSRGIPVPESEAVEDREDIIRGIRKYGLPLMIKARSDSYDGRGNFVLRDVSQVDEVLTQFNGRSLMLQKYIPFDSEISIISARNTQGEISTFPVGENIHGIDYNILLTTIVPARVSERVTDRAREVAEKTMDALRGAGVFGIEMFVVRDEVMINEIAPRVHNSGHYTIEACKTSQFEQHLRAINGEGLGDTSLCVPSAVMHNIIGVERYTGDYRIMYDRQTINGTCQTHEGVYVHNYGKHQVKPYRKMGHVTILGNASERQEELLNRASSIQNLINIEPQ